MNICLLYLDENLDPQGSKAITKDSQIIDDVIHDTGMSARISLNPSHKFMKLESWSHTRDKPKSSTRDQYHLILDVELPIGIDENFIAHNWLYYRIQDDNEKLLKFCVYPKYTLARV